MIRKMQEAMKQIDEEMMNEFDDILESMNQYVRIRL